MLFELVQMLDSTHTVAQPSAAYWQYMPLVMIVHRGNPVLSCAVLWQ
jgi:hypothetical protein